MGLHHELHLSRPMFVMGSNIRKAQLRLSRLRCQGAPLGGCGKSAAAAEELPEMVEAPPVGSAGKGKSCKGCVYYSSLLKSQSKNPRCVGISRTLNQVPKHVISESEVEASKEGRNLDDFSYICVGYSMFHDNKKESADNVENQAELPFCVGVELLVDRRIADHVPAHSNSRGDGQVISPHKSYKPPQSMGEEFMNRFTKNASLVAGGVARNMQRVGNYVKDSFDDILYPYRRRPK